MIAKATEVKLAISLFNIKRLLSPESDVICDGCVIVIGSPLHGTQQVRSTELVMRGPDQVKAEDEQEHPGDHVAQHLVHHVQSAVMLTSDKTL